MERIRICLLVDTVGLSAGTERQVIETARRLNKDKFAVHVCCLEPSEQLTALNQYCQTAVFPLVSVYSKQGVQQLAQLRRYLEEHDIQLVHAFMNKTAVCAVLTSLASSRIVITSRLNTGYWYTSFYKLQFRLLNLGTARVMANSGEAKRIAMEAEGLSDNKVDVMYQGVNMQIYKPGAGNTSTCEKLGIPKDFQVIGIVANLRPVKDIPLFLRAAALVAVEFHNVAFLIVGSGELLPELRSLASELNIGHLVFFTQGQGLVIDYLSRMSIGCLTSHSEGFSNAILEYMAVGIPAVATAVGGNREAIVDGETGSLVYERTPEAFAKPLLQLLQQEEQRLEMGKRGLARCAEYFELSRTIINLEEYYRSLVPSQAGTN